MANYYGHGRTNYFEVKDEQAFLDDVSLMPVEVIRSGEKDELIGLLSKDDCGWFWSYFTDDSDDIEDDSDDIEVDWKEFFAKHLKPESVAIIMDIGNEKLRYLNGSAYAYNSMGEEMVIRLDDIYEKAKLLGSKITEATY